MIIWIASYPKSGNTWLRALLSTYFFSNDGTFHDSTDFSNITIRNKHIFKIIVIVVASRW